MFRPLASALIVGCSALGGENDALMQSQTRNEDALEFVNNKERVQLAELHKTMLAHHHEYKQEVKKEAEQHRGGYRAHLTKHRDEVTGMTTSNVRQEKMRKTARELEHEYRSILEMMVSKPQLGNEYQPPTEMLSEVEAVFDVIATQLGVEKDASQTLIENANADIKVCNDNKDHEYSKDGGVNAKEGVSDAARTDHKTCRGEENALICDAKHSCDLFNAQRKCEHEQNWFAKLTDTSVPTKETLLLSKVILQATDCRARLITEHAKARACDTTQGVFETKFCGYANFLQDTSDAYDICYRIENNTRYNVVEPDVRELEHDGKLILKMVKKVKCYITTLKNVQYTSELPMQKDIDACTGLDPVVSELDIDYITPEPKAILDMSTIDHWPSVPDNGWADDEYGEGHFQDDCKSTSALAVPAFQAALHPQKLKEVVACTAMDARPV